MRAPSNLARGSVRFNMTPMIDVSFLLIIFFLVSSHLAQQEVQLELDLPQAASGQRPADEESRRIVFNVHEDGAINMGSGAVEGTDLERVIASERERAGEDLEVRIRSDRNVAYRHVEPIMVACARSGVWKVSFAVVRRERNGG